MAYGAAGIGEITEAFILGCSCLIGIEQFNMTLLHMSMGASIQYGIFLGSIAVVFLYMLFSSRNSEFYRNGYHTVYATLCLILYAIVKWDLSLGKLTFLLSGFLGIVMGILVVHSSCYYSRHKSVLLGFCIGLFSARLLPSICWYAVKSDDKGFSTHLRDIAVMVALIRFLSCLTSLFLKMYLGNFEIWDDVVDDKLFGELMGASNLLKKSKRDGDGMFFDTSAPGQTIDDIYSLIRPNLGPLFSLLLSILVFLGYSPIFCTSQFKYAPHLMSSLSKSEMISHIVGSCFGLIFPPSKSDSTFVCAVIFILHFISAALMFLFHKFFCIYGLFFIVILPAFLLGYIFSYSLGLIIDVSLRQNCSSDDPQKMCCGDDVCEQCFCKTEGIYYDCRKVCSKPPECSKDVIIWFDSGTGGKIECTCWKGCCKCFCCNDCCCCHKHTQQPQCGCKCCQQGSQCCKVGTCKNGTCSCRCKEVCKNNEEKCTCCSSGGCKDKCLKCVCCDRCAKLGCGNSSGSGGTCNCPTVQKENCNKCLCCKNISLVSGSQHFLLTSAQTSTCNDCQLTVRLEAKLACLCCINGVCSKHNSATTNESGFPVKGNVYFGSLSANCPVCSIRKVERPETFVYGDGSAVSNEFDIKDIICSWCCHADLIVDLFCVLRNTYFRVSAVNYPTKYFDIYGLFFTYSSYSSCKGASKEQKSARDHKPITKLFLSHDATSNKWKSVTSGSSDYNPPPGGFENRALSVKVSKKSSFYVRVDRYRFFLTLMVWMKVAFLVALVFLGCALFKGLGARSSKISTDICFTELRKAYLKPEHNWHQEVLDRIKDRKSLIGGTLDLKSFADTSRQIFSDADCENCLEWAQSVARVENKDFNAVTWSVLTGLYHSYFLLKFFNFQSFFLYWEEAWKLEYSYFCKHFTPRMDRIMLKSKFALDQLHDRKLPQPLYDSIQQARVSAWEGALKEMQNFSNLYESESEPWDLPLEVHGRLEYYIERWNTRLPYLVSWCNFDTNILDWTTFLYGFSLINNWSTKFEPWIAQVSNCVDMPEDELDLVSSRLNRNTVDEIQVSKYKFH
ncbi:hypothetical protein BEWA_023950 [Theileria equi strain WA]|uniref:Uncharacterized protein n=1 Tax=Theileria equi strain WA TaxID=1537102 RepID=L0AWZ6_THEEQ|nr:hypothetical protein BEWA_023950 [Theileria equi strain WA]AFZ79546.1 hypothetical protein BEWA_023950 [Theileria equi strain WA]|eukprot:XP_004829212.1 hypothetical protein BEWA_023950 [Theileria equi strain WA]